jgi:hypothetical protein
MQNHTSLPFKITLQVKNSLILNVDKIKKYFCKFQKVHNGSKNIENVLFSL